MFSVCIILHVRVGNIVLGIISNIMCVDTYVYVCMFVRACARVCVRVWKYIHVCAHSTYLLNFSGVLHSFLVQTMTWKWCVFSVQIILFLYAWRGMCLPCDVTAEILVKVLDLKFWKSGKFGVKIIHFWSTISRPNGKLWIWNFWYFDLCVLLFQMKWFPNVFSPCPLSFAGLL